MTARELSVVVEDESAKLRLGAEVQEKAYFDDAAAQVVQQLGRVRGVNESRGLQLDNNSSANEEVRAKSSHRPPAEVGQKAEFPLDAETAILERDAHRFSIDRLDEPEPYFIVNLIEDAQNPASELLVFQSACFRVHLRPCVHPRL